MSVALLIIDDGRGHLPGCIESAHDAGLLHGEVDDVVIVDDTRHELGFCGAIQAGWARVLGLLDLPDFVFHLESDFRFNRAPDLVTMRRILEEHPHLLQVSLKRQPWNEREIAAGGIVEADPLDFHEVRDWAGTWTEHRRYFTTNPSLYSTDLLELGWPQTGRSEGVFTHQLLDRLPMDVRPFAIHGRRLDPPAVHHLGPARAGHGY